MFRKTFNKYLINVAQVRDGGLCVGCGTCEIVCPVKAIVISRDDRKGIYLPDVDSERCTQCGLCLKVCPGIGVDFDRLGDEFLDGEQRDDRIGIFDACYTGWASNHNIRYNSASGGLATSLFVYALEKNLIDGALVLDMLKSNQLETTPLIATTPSEIIAASGSKYCPAAINRGLRAVLENEGRFAVVGLPCHIQAVRKLESAIPSMREKIVLHLGLFCANNNTYLGTEYFLRNNGISPDQVRAIRYRAEGWPGRIRISMVGGSYRIIPRATTETKWYRKALFASAFHYDFMLPRCLLCADQTSELADISLGDPWLTEYKQSDRIGNSLVIVRNRRGADFLSGALNEGIVSLEKVDLSVVKRAQNYYFKEGVGARIRLRRSLGLPVPDYSERDLSFTPRQIMRALRYTPSYFSHHRWLWPAIRALAIVHYIQQRAIGKVKAPIRFILRRLGLRRTAGSPR